MACACAAHVFVPPAGPGTPAPDAAAAWAEATSACRDVKSVNGTLHVAVRRGIGLTVDVIVTSAGRIRLEDSAVFALAGTSAQAQLLLRREGRVVTAPADQIVEAFVGVRIGPERFLAVLTGCGTASPAKARLDAAMRFGKMIAVPSADGRVFLEPRDRRWRVMAVEGDGLTVEYHGGFDGDWPHAWRARSTSEAVVLDVSVDSLDVNGAPVPPEAFQLNVPSDATPMSLDQLRAWRRER